MIPRTSQLSSPNSSFQQAVSSTRFYLLHSVYMQKQWVVGLLFNSKRELALILKNHPDWQAGKLNGIGGKIEEGEPIIKAMQREFREEAGVYIEVWREFAVLKLELGEVHFLVAHGDYTLQSLTDESVAFYKLDQLRSLPHIDNLDWLIPLALDPLVQTTEIKYAALN